MSKPFTEDELLDLMIQQTQLAPQDARELSRYMFAESEAARALIVEIYYDVLIEQFRGQMSPEILANARNLAETAAASLQRSFIEQELKNIGEVIAQGIADGKHPRAIARELKAVNNLDSVRAKKLQKFIDSEPAPSQAEIDALREALLKERREVIAITEAAKAVSEGDAAAAKADGAKWKIWQTTGDDRVSDLCQANEAQGPIPIDEKFNSGHDTTPGHPRCRCSVSYINNPALVQTLREFQKQAAADTAAAKGGE